MALTTKRRARCAIGLLVCAGISLATHLSAQDQPAAPPTFRAGVELLVVEVTVRDRGGRLVTDLTRDDFSVSEGGRPISVAQFTVDRRPLTAVIMVSTTGDLPAHRAFAEALIAANDDGDRFMIGSYGWEVAVNPLLTANRLVLQRILNEELWYGLTHPVFTAVYRAGLALPVDAKHPAIILIGVDASRASCIPHVRCVSASDATAMVAERGAMLYGIKTGVVTEHGDTIVPRDAWSHPMSVTRPPGPLVELAKAMGGYLSTESIPRPGWPKAALEVLAELRLRYVIGLAIAGHTGLGRVEIRTSRQGSTVNVHRQRVQTGRQP